MKTFYRMRLSPDEDGLTIVTNKLVSIHETPCFHFCISDREYGYLQRYRKNEGDTPLQHAKRHRRRIYRISKGVSRIAFETEEEAFEHLRFLKRKQLGHMKREMSFVEAFLEKTEDGIKATRSEPELHQRVVPDTRELVHEFLIFS